MLGHSVLRMTSITCMMTVLVGTSIFCLTGIYLWVAWFTYLLYYIPIYMYGVFLWVYYWIVLQWQYLVYILQDYSMGWCA